MYSKICLFQLVLIISMKFEKKSSRMVLVNTCASNLSDNLFQTALTLNVTRFMLKFKKLEHCYQLKVSKSLSQLTKSWPWPSYQRLWNTLISSSFLLIKSFLRVELSTKSPQQENIVKWQKLFLRNKIFFFDFLATFRRLQNTLHNSFDKSFT